MAESKGREMKNLIIILLLMISQTQAANSLEIPDEELQSVIEGFISCYGTLNALADAFDEDNRSGTAEFARSNARDSKISAQWLMSMRDGAATTLGEYNQYVDSASYSSYYSMTLALENNDEETQTSMISICYEQNSMQHFIAQAIREQLLRGSRTE
jgi:hypothetical protein